MGSTVDAKATEAAPKSTDEAAGRPESSEEAGGAAADAPPTKKARPLPDAALASTVAALRSHVTIPAVGKVVLARATPQLFAPLLAPSGAALLARALEEARTVPTAERCLGMMVGMCVGDAVGAPLEFSAATDAAGDGGMRWDAATNAYPRGEVNNFRLRRGQWTDDASMGLALADSLLAEGGFDGSDARVRWRAWWDHGYANAFKYDAARGSRRSVGLGGNIGRSLDAGPGSAFGAALSTARGRLVGERRGLCNSRAWCRSVSWEQRS